MKRITASIILAFAMIVSMIPSQLSVRITAQETAASTIAEALAGEKDTEFTVKGVVTLVDGKNIYIQDETGGIDLYFSAAPSDIALGDTVIGSGKRAEYNGLPELSGAAYEKSSGMTLTAAEKTIGTLTESDICTYVHLSDLTVTKVSGTTVTVTDSEKKTIDIFKTVSDTIEVNDILDVKAAVGVYKGTLQLRNTIKDEIKITKPAFTVAAPTADVPSGTVEKGTVVTFSTETEGAAILISLDGGETWNDGNWYTVNKSLTLVVKAVYGEYESAPVTFTYQVEGDYATIAEALAGEKDTEFTVKGVVTLVDGKNIYIQDATGGIDLYFSSAPSDIALGDTVIGSGKRAEYNGLPELSGAAYEKSSGMTLTAAEKTIGTLTESDICTYVHLSDLTVTKVSGTTVTVTDSEKKTIDIFKTVSDTIEVNDILDVKAAVGVYKGTLQLRNTIKDEIKITKPVSEIAAPTADIPSGTVEKGTVVTFSTETEGAVIQISLDGGVTWNDDSTYTVNESVTLDVKAVLNDKESKIVTFDYTVEGDTGNLVTDLSQLKDGATVAIYNQSHGTAISSEPNGDWYLKAEPAEIRNNKVAKYTDYLIWSVKVNEDGTYSFYSYSKDAGGVDDTRSITVWQSGTYAELSVNVAKYPDNKWNLTPSAIENCFYFSSPSISNNDKPAYINAYVRNGTEVFSGRYILPTDDNFKDKDYSLQFYLVDPAESSAPYDDGEWDGVLNKGSRYVIYSPAAEATIGLLKEASYSMSAIPSTVEDGFSAGGNGTYVFTVDTMGRYYTFMTNGKYLATNNDEEMLLLAPNADGSVPETAKWFLKKVNDSYVIYNKKANYNGTPVCIEYYSNVFSGWTFKEAEPDIFLFNFFPLKEGTKEHEDIVQAPYITITSDDTRYVQQDYTGSFLIEDLCPSVETMKITYKAGSKEGEVSETSKRDDGSITFTIPAAELDQVSDLTEFTFTVTVTNGYTITYSAEKTVTVIDEPFFEEMTPEPGSETGEDKKPVISVRILNAGENPKTVMTINNTEVEAVYKDGVLTYTPAEDLEDGHTDVHVSVTREDGVSSETSWAFNVGEFGYRFYYGQLHSHTTYSDGSGSLDTALDYVRNIPESANVDFVAFTDHSNYFDTTSAANPADAMNDASLMTEASAKLWKEYKNKVAAFNAEKNGRIAIAGYEMTWSGGPGHINSFNTKGLVSRNDAALNNKTNDAGMKLYYETMKKDNHETLHQFNHPGKTFGNFTDFSYWDEETDERMFMVEVGNGEGQIGAGGYYPSYEEYILALDKGWHIAPTNNQDNHKGLWGNANEARDVILTNDFSEQGLYDAIRARRMYATEDKNLQIYYTLNGYIMGEILSEENTPEKVIIQVNLFDPDSKDAVEKAEVVGEGGKTLYTWDDAETMSQGFLEAELEPSGSYYFIRITQKDGDIAVTAPVWAGTPVKAGIDSITVDPEEPSVNQEFTLTTKLFNNEADEITLKSMTYTLDGMIVAGTDTTERKIPASGTIEVPFKYTGDTAKKLEFLVTAVTVINGKEYTFTKTQEVLIRNAEAGVTPIQDVQNQQESGMVYTIEGVVTSNASGHDKDTAFFDAIYVQDETSGICCFPVSGEYKIGDKVRIEGYTDSYQGEHELQVISINVIGTGKAEPEEVTAKQINNQAVIGKLITLKGTVVSYEEANGLIQTIMVKDGAGDIARVFIDGYITTGKEVENCVEGASITVTGLASYDNTWKDTAYFPRIRVRDRADVICTTKQEVKTIAMHRLYNPYSSEHFYTGNEKEKDVLTGLGWNYEGIGWYAPEESGTPVYRLYNPYNGGDHHFTKNKKEYDVLVSLGWNGEGIGWYSDDSESVPVYREYNPNMLVRNHNYTANKKEHDVLVSIGWNDEGIGWYGAEH